jgi:hypothetical protein
MYFICMAQEISHQLCEVLYRLNEFTASHLTMYIYRFLLTIVRRVRWMREVHRLRSERRLREQWVEHHHNWTANPTALCALHRLVGQYVVTTLQVNDTLAKAQEEQGRATLNWTSYAACKVQESS